MHIHVRSRSCRVVVLCFAVLSACASFAAEPRSGFAKVVLRPLADVDAKVARALLVDVGGEVVEEYAEATVGYVPIEKAEALQSQGVAADVDVTLREDFDQIFLPGGTIDTRHGLAASLPTLHPDAPYADHEVGLYVIQFTAPIRLEWTEALRSMATLVQYVPYNAYIIATTPKGAAEVRRLPYVQYVTMFHSGLKPFDDLDAPLLEMLVQIANIGESTTSAVEEVAQWARGPVTTETFGEELRVRGTFRPSDLRVILAHPLVFGIAAVPTAEYSDERVAMSMTTNIDVSGTPTNPTGYKTWLQQACAYCNDLQDDGFAIAFVDTGLDGGIGGPHHADLPSSRIRYGTNFDPTVGTPGQPCGVDTSCSDTVGHGTMVVGMAAGDPSVGTDDGGFWYGTGIAPSAGIFMTKGNNGSATSVTPITTVATEARITANPPVFIQNHSYNAYTNPIDYYQSGGALHCDPTSPPRYDGRYSILSRDFDRAVRDANNSGTAQAITLVASSGNQHQGSGLAPCGSDTRLSLPPATAKNVIGAGGAENVRDETEEWDCQDTRADSYANIMRDSRRGTLNANWYKPELMAPASILTSAKSADYTIGNFCAPLGFPDPTLSTTEYLVSTGTSFAAPAIAGAALLASRVYAEWVTPYCTETANCAPGAASPSLLKAMLIATAQSMKGGLDNADGLASHATIGAAPNAVQGFGRVTLGTLLSDYPRRDYVNETQMLSALGSWTQTYTVDDATQPVSIALTWTDVPALQSSSGTATTTTPLVNDLHLSVEYGAPCHRFIGNRVDATTELSTDFTCTTGTFDTVNNSERVRFNPSGITTFTIKVVNATTSGSQDFSIAAYNAYPSSTPPPAMPTSFSATATSTTVVDITWSAVSGATAYDLQRKDAGSMFTTIAHPTTTTYTDTSRTPGHAYVYRVRARTGARVSTYTTPDIATTFALTDDPVTAEVTAIRSIHIEELREVVDAVRDAADLSPGTYTDPVLSGLSVNAVHFTDVLSALNTARTALGIPTTSFAEILTPGTTTIKKAHLDVLRDGSR